MRMLSQPHEPHVRAALDEALRAARGAHAKATERVWHLDERIQALEALMQAEPLDPTTQSVRPLLVALAKANGGLLRTDDAARQFAHLYPSQRAANKSLFTVLRRATDFQQVGIDAWRYIEPPPARP